MRYRTEWRRRVDFAEFAEALAIPTDHVLAAMPAYQSGAYVVLYGGVPDGAPVYGVTLARDIDGTLFAVNEPELLPDFGQQLHERIRLRLARGDD